MSPNVNNIREMLAHYQLRYQSTEFIDFNQIKLLEIPEWFKQELHFALVNRGEPDKEAFTSEFIIVPCLREIWKRHPQLNLFSHVALQTEELTVIPDYLVTAKDPTGYKTVYKPLLLTIEAKNEKNEKIEQGWVQALLQAVICQKLNGTQDIPIWMIVTTGDFWQFGQLERQLFTKHPLSVSLQNLEILLGILDHLFTECEQSLSESGFTRLED